MQQEIVTRLNQNFENAAQTQAGVTYWLARDIQGLLEYTQWRNFLEVIEKAKTACENSGQPVASHFADIHKTVEIGSGTKRDIKDLKLTRYACYLIAQNGDPRKASIAFAQTYFATQAGTQEVQED